MADDKTKKGPQDRSRINVHEPWEVRWWMQKFGVTKSVLVAAVEAVGTSAKVVEDYLKKNKR